MSNSEAEAQKSQYFKILRKRLLFCFYLKGEKPILKAKLEKTF